MKSARYIRVPGKGPNAATNPMNKHSLLGSADELKKYAVAQLLLLGSICLLGEATVWYGKYNTGKTIILLHLIDDAVRSKRIDPSNIYYVNADDSTPGLAEKARLFDDLGAHMLAPGHKDFNTNTLIIRMEEMIASDSARGVFIVVDTLKKFVDVMDKKSVRAFTSLIRRFAMRGGTFLALAHTNKRDGPDGKPIPEGTADILSDFDCGYLLAPAGEVKSTGERVVEFTCVKSRGRAAQMAQYAYDPDPDLSYTERLCSVREVDPNDEVERVADNPEESYIIENIELCIRHGSLTKMAILKTAWMATKVSRRTVLGVLEQYTGDDPKTHRWNYARREHGRMEYFLLTPPSDGG